MRYGLPLPIYDLFCLHNGFLLGLSLIFAHRNAHNKRLRICVPVSNVHALPIGVSKCLALQYYLPFTIHNNVSVRNCSLYAIGNAFSTRITYGKRVLLRVQLLILLSVALCNEQRLRNSDLFG